VLFLREAGGGVLLICQGPALGGIVRRAMRGRHARDG
jgi:hypothetical protein